jgi:hypothetical protein
MTDQDRFDAVEVLESRAYEFVHALTYAKVLARMAVAGKVPDHSTLLEKVDEAIDRWNELINSAPGELRRVESSILGEENLR